MLQCGRWLHLPDKNGDMAAEDQVDQEVDQEFQCMHEACLNGHSIQSVYTWWIRLLVTQWEALDIYSTFGDKVVEGIKIHIVVAAL